MRKRIGEFFVDRGVLTRAQVAQVLRHSEASGLRFGEAAQELGLISREKLIEVFGPSFKVDFFHLEPEFFPLVTKDALPVELVIKLGALPLGFKTERGWFKPRKALNLGMLDPERQGTADEALQAASQRLGSDGPVSTKAYLVLAEQFLHVLNKVYGISDEQLRARDRAELDPVLAMFIGRQ